MKTLLILLSIGVVTSTSLSKFLLERHKPEYEDIPLNVARRVPWDNRIPFRAVDYPCRSVGFYAHPTNCSMFYRCVNFNNTGSQEFSIFLFACPQGNRFVPNFDVCIPGKCPSSQSQIAQDEPYFPDEGGPSVYPESGGSVDDGQDSQGGGNQGDGNQGEGNQGEMNEGEGNQGDGNQGVGNQGVGNQGQSNQGQGNQGQGNQGQGNQGQGNQGQGNQGQGNQGQGNQGQGNQGQGNQGQGNQGQGNQGQDYQGQGNQGEGSQGDGNQEAAAGASSTGGCATIYVAHAAYCNRYHLCERPSMVYQCGLGTVFSEENQMCRLKQSNKELCIGKDIHPEPVFKFASPFEFGQDIPPRQHTMPFHFRMPYTPETAEMPTAQQYITDNFRAPTYSHKSTGESGSDEDQYFDQIGSYHTIQKEIEKDPLRGLFSAHYKPPATQFILRTLPGYTPYNSDSPLRYYNVHVPNVYSNFKPDFRTSAFVNPYNNFYNSFYARNQQLARSDYFRQPYDVDESVESFEDKSYYEVE